MQTFQRMSAMMTADPLETQPHNAELAAMEPTHIGPFAIRYVPRERWELCMEMVTHLTALIPMPELSLQALMSLRAGMVVESGWQATQDVPLEVEATFLANVELEPVGDKLGVRINSFLESPKATPGPATISPSKAVTVDTAATNYSLEDLKLRPTLCFGATMMPMRDVMGLCVGDTVMLDRPVIAPVTIVAGGRIVASGDLVLVNGGYAVQIGQVAELTRHLPSCTTSF